MLVVVLSVLTSKPQTDAWFWFVLERITDLYLDTLSMSNVRPPQTLLKNPRVLWVVESNFLKLCETNLWQILNHLSPFVNLAKVIPISLWHYVRSSCTVELNNTTFHIFHLVKSNISVSMLLCIQIPACCTDCIHYYGMPF